MRGSGPAQHVAPASDMVWTETELLVLAGLPRRIKCDAEDVRLLAAHEQIRAREKLEGGHNVTNSRHLAHGLCPLKLYSSPAVARGERDQVIVGADQRSARA